MERSKKETIKNILPSQSTAKLPSFCALTSPSRCCRALMLGTIQCYTRMAQGQPCGRRVYLPTGVWWR